VNHCGSDGRETEKGPGDHILEAALDEGEVAMEGEHAHPAREGGAAGASWWGGTCKVLHNLN